MSIASKIDHTRYVLINRLATPLGSFILLMIIARQSDLLLGEYAIIMAFYFVMQMLPLLGLTTFVMREVARKPEEAGKFFISIGFLSLVGCVIVDVGTYFSLNLFNYSDSIQSGVYLLGFIIAPGILIFISELIFMSLYRAKTVGLIAIIENTGRIALSVLVLIYDGGLAELMWVFLLARSSSCLAYIVIMKRVGILKRIELPDFKLLQRTLHLLPAFLLGTLLLAFLGRLDFFALSLAMQVETVGYYAIGFRVFDISIVILSGLIMALFPWLSRKFTGSGLQYRVALRVTLQGFTVGLCLFCLFAVLYAQYYVLLLFTNQYPQPVLATQLFMAILVFAGIDHLSSSLLHASDMQVQDTKALTLGGIVFSASLFWLIPILGLYGAIVAKGLQALVQLIFRLTTLQRSVGSLGGLRDLVSLAIFVSVLAGVAFYLVNTGFIVKTLGAAAATFVILPLLLFVLGIFQPLRILRFFWRPDPTSTRVGIGRVMDLIVLDQRRHTKYYRAKSPLRSRHSLDRGQLAVLFYRISSYLNDSGAKSLTRLIGWVSNKWMHTTITPNSVIGPGFVLDSPDKVYISAIAGQNMTCIGCVEVGSKEGYQAVIDAGVVIESGSVVKAENPTSADTLNE